MSAAANSWQSSYDLRRPCIPQVHIQRVYVIDPRTECFAASLCYTRCYFQTNNSAMIGSLQSQDDTGKVTHLILHQGGDRQAKKID